MQAEVILRLVSGALQDLEPGLESRWPWEGREGRIGLLDFLNAAKRAIVLQRPDLTALTGPVRLEPGMRQRLPSRRHHGAKKDATMLIDLTRNMGEDGEHPGPAIVSAQMDILLAWALPDVTGCVVENYAYDRVVNRDVYYVYPAVTPCRDVWVEATYSTAPEVITCITQDIGLPDEYAAALQHHVLASILSGDNEPSNASKAAYHQQMFASLLGIKTSVDVSWPKAKSSMAGGAS